MTEPPAPGNFPPPGNYPPPPNYPPPGNYPPPPAANYPAHGNYPPPPAASYPPPPPGNYPPPPPGNYPPPAPGYYPAAPGVAGMLPKEAYTPWLTRVLAYLIDSAPAAVLFGIGQAFATNDCVSDTTDSSFNVSCVSHPSALTVVLWFAAFAFAVWNYGYRQGTTGSSIGKSVMKFKVVAEQTGQPIGFGKSVVRQLAHVVDAIICNIGYLFPLWDAKRQTLADKIMSTVCLPF